MYAVSVIVKLIIVIKKQTYYSVLEQKKNGNLRERPHSVKLPVEVTFFPYCNCHLGTFLLNHLTLSSSF